MILNRRIVPFLSLFAALVLQGCIRSGGNYENCRLDLDVSFYSKTACQTENTYPEEIKDLVTCVFDNSGVLIGYTESDGVTLGEDYAETLEVNGRGISYVVAWSGIDESLFDVNELRIGGTRKDDLLFRLKRTGDEAYRTDGAVVYFGESPAIYLPDAKETGSVSVPAAVNMTEVTNRITIFVEGLLTDISDYEINIETNSASMETGGRIAPDDLIKYDKVDLSDTEVLAAGFTTLKLETGYTNTIVIRNTVEDRELFRGSLLGSLLMKNPEINLACDHDFTIRFTAEDTCNCGTYMIAEIWVNNWLVHSYDTDM